MHQRLQIERNAVGGAKYLAFRADQMLTEGSTTEQVLEWLHSQVKPTQQRANGITYILDTRIMREKGIPPLRYKIVLRDRSVVYRPIR